MKRLVVFVLLMALVCVASAVSKPDQGYARFAQKVQIGTTQNNLFIPGFRAEKVTIMLSAAQTATMTVYEPYNSGPLSATDSFVVTVTGSGIGIVTDYYGPTSDTMRVTSSANTSTFHAFR